MDPDLVFTALADPTRRAVSRALANQPRRAGELAGDVGMSPPALSRHLRVLRHAGMIVEQGTKDDARVRIYTLAPGALVRVRTWLDEIEGYWSEQLAAFKAHAEGTAATSASGRRRRKR